MKVKKVIESVDALCPNDFPIEQKLEWYNTAEAFVGKIKKEYLMAEAWIEDGENLLFLPESVSFEQIDYVVLDGKRIPKTDFGSCGIWGIRRQIGISKGKRRLLKIAYQKAPRPVRYFALTVENAVISGNSLTLGRAHEFQEGDGITLEFEGRNLGEFTALETSENGGDYVITLIGGEFEPQSGSLTLTSALSQKTLAAAPYDELYAHFIIGKMCYFRQDYDGYNNAMAVWGSLYSDYEKRLVSNGEIKSFSRLTNVL